MGDRLQPVGVELAALEDSDDRELEQLGSRLVAALRTTDAESVRVSSAGDAPRGSKGLELLALGHIVVEIASLPALRTIVAVLRDFVTHQPVRSVKISIAGDVLELTAVSDADQRRLVDAWLARQTALAAVRDDGPTGTA